MTRFFGVLFPFQHENGLITCKGVNDNGVYFLDTIVFDDPGRISAVINGAPSFKYHYGSDGILASSVSYGRSANAFHFYSWQGGDLISDSVIQVGLAGPIDTIRWVETYAYYTDKNFQLATTDLDFLSMHGLTLFRTKHLLRAVYSTKGNTSSATTHNYTFDSDGKILADTSYTDGYMRLNTFRYECN